jgi:hypothetical protein
LTVVLLREELCGGFSGLRRFGSWTLEEFDLEVVVVDEFAMEVDLQVV